MIEAVAWACAGMVVGWVAGTVVGWVWGACGSHQEQKRALGRESEWLRPLIVDLRDLNKQLLDERDKAQARWRTFDRETERLLAKGLSGCGEQPSGGTKEKGSK